MFKLSTVLFAFICALIPAAVLADGMPTSLERTAPVLRWELGGGFFLPLLIAVILQSNWSRQGRTLVGAAVVIIASLIGLLLDDRFTWGRWVEASIIVMVVTIVSLYGFWHPLTITPRLERATTITRDLPPPPLHTATRP